MISAETIFMIMIFLMVAGFAYAVMLMISPRATKSRLNKITSKNASLDKEQSNSEWTESVVRLTEPFAKLALPKDDWEKSTIQTRFMHAGFRSSQAATIFFGIKAFLTFVLPIIFLVFFSFSDTKWGTNGMIFMLLILASIGYYLPNIILNRIIELRKRELFENFPDAIDLMTVCVEAGLGLDAALAKVGEEMRLSCKVLSDEIYLVGLELRAGASREKALRNLALRTGVEEIEALVAMLVQADRFGTSTAASLRVYSDTLRTKRRLRAEEAAAKIALKLLFPLIFFIFPSLLVVLMGPAFINIYRVMLPVFAGE